MHHNSSPLAIVIWKQGHRHTLFEKGFCSPRATTGLPENRLFTIPSAWNCTQFQSYRPSAPWAWQYRIQGRQRSLTISNFRRKEWRTGLAHFLFNTCLYFLSPFGLMTLVVIHRHRDSFPAIICICIHAHPGNNPHLTRWACAHLVLVSHRLIVNVKMKFNSIKSNPTWQGLAVTFRSFTSLLVVGADSLVRPSNVGNGRIFMCCEI